MHFKIKAGGTLNNSYFDSSNELSLTLFWTTFNYIKIEDICPDLIQLILCSTTSDMGIKIAINQTQLASGFSLIIYCSTMSVEIEIS